MIPLKTHYNPITPIQNIQQILIVDIVYRDILCINYNKLCSYYNKLLYIYSYSNLYTCIPVPLLWLPAWLNSTNTFIISRWCLTIPPP